jgi:hypothetical protein
VVRVGIEMAGLVIATNGTVLSSLAR